jgi:hypothetical protein
MNKPTPKQTAAFNTLLNQVENHWTDKAGRVWGSMYLPNCQGYGTRSFGGVLGSLKNAGVYDSENGDCSGVFGRVLLCCPVPAVA